MSCPQRDKVDLYVDNELEPAAQQQFSAHLGDCEECTAAVNAQMEFKRNLRMAGKAFSAPPELHASVYRAIHPEKAVSRWWKWAMVPLCVLLLAVIGYLLLPRSPGADPMMARLVDQHVTNLASANPVDVVSSDRHTVKPWFQGKLPFTFNLPESGTDFKLAGAKLVYAEQRPGAELWYEAGPHKISVFVFQAVKAGDQKASVNHELSFNVTRWKQGQLEYYLVTDGSQEEAGKLVQMFKEANKT